MSFSPIMPPGRIIPYEATNPVVEAKLIESSDGSLKTINLKFRICLDMDFLINNGYSNIEYFISHGSSENSYRFFTGNIENMENDIIGWAASKYDSESSYISEEHNSFYYKEESLHNFLPDSVLSRVDAYRFNRSYEYQTLGSTKEASIPIIFYNPVKDSPRELYYKISAVGSRSSGISCELPFPRLTVNQSFSGTSPTYEYSSSFTPDQLAFYFANSSIRSQQKAFDLDNQNDMVQSWPVTLNASLEFESPDFPVINSLLVKDSLTLSVRFNRGEGSRSRDGLVPIEFSLRNAILADSINLSPLVVTAVPPSKTSPTGDILSIVNNNDTSVKGKVGLYGFSEPLGTMTKDFHHSFIIPANSEMEIPVPTSTKFASRFYQGYGVSSIYEDFSSLINDPSNHPPQVPFESNLPYISNNNFPDQSDPKILAILNSDTGNWEIHVTNIPHYVDKIKFYAKHVKNKGPASYRSPGKSRSEKLGWRFFGSNPSAPGQTLDTNTTSISIPSNSISKNSSYEILADFEVQDSVVDTISTPLHNPRVRNIKSLLECSFEAVSIPGDYSSDTITINTTISPTSDSVVDTLISQTTLTNEYLESFNESMAESTVNVWYKVVRYNLGGKSRVEDLGYFNSGTHRIPVPADSSITRKYALKVYALTIGQLLPSNPPTAVSPAWPGAGGGSQQYFKNYAKYNSTLSETYEKLPNDNYLNTSTIALNAFTGHQSIASVSSGEKITPVSIGGLNVYYNQVLGIRYLSWSIDESLANNVPEYYIVKANYGGVTAPVAWAINAVDGDSIKKYMVCDKKLGTAIGKTIYQVFGVYMDGQIRDTGLSAVYNVSNNRNEKKFNLR